MNDDFLDALNGSRGSLDGWLESASENEVRAAVRRVMSPTYSLRDKFAAEALNAVCERYMLANCNSETEIDMEITNAAALAYRLADAMLKAREVQP